MVENVSWDNPDFHVTASKVLPAITPELAKCNRDKVVIAIAGETGSGKTVTALCLQKLFSSQNRSAAVLHQDDYYHYPPETNRLRRQADSSWAGVKEVNLELMDLHIEAFLSGDRLLCKPLIDFAANAVLFETIDLSYVKVLIVEGAYVSLLKNVDCRIFIQRTYKDTEKQRIARARDIFDENLNTILAMEHEIISSHSELADFYITSDYEVEMNGKRN